jgi:NADH:ubiquinone oxidoreductase subunit H
VADGIAWPVIWTLIKIVAVLAPLMGAVAYLTLWERKLLGFMQVRTAPTGWALSACCSRLPTPSSC